jgi:hypothetical protein
VPTKLLENTPFLKYNAEAVAVPRLSAARRRTESNLPRQVHAFREITADAKRPAK